MSLYIDGNLDFRIETTGNSLVAGSHNIHLGGDPSNPYASQNIFFDGSLDEFRFYDRSLSDSEISSLYSYERTDRLALGLKAYYPFNGNANDESNYSNDATVTGAVVTTDRFGSLNQAYLFDGVNDYIDTPSNLKGYGIENAFTLSSWFNVKKGEESGFRNIMEDGTSYNSSKT